MKSYTIGRRVRMPAGWSQPRTSEETAGLGPRLDQIIQKYRSVGTGPRLRTRVADINFGAPPILLAVAAMAVLSLTGCATRVRYVPVPPPPLADRLPAQLLSCRGRPTPGALDLQSDVARYVVDLDAAGADCRRKLNAIRQIVEADGRKQDDVK